MKYLFLFFLSALITIPAISQPRKGYVYLKNGSILKGKFRYNEDLSKLQIESAGNLWIFKADEIDHVTTKNEPLNDEFDFMELNSPFALRTEIGVLAGNSGNSQTAPFSFSTVLNYVILPKLSVGAGFGLEFLKETYLPAFINLEYKLRNSGSTPFAFLKSGYELALEESNNIYNSGIQPLYYDYIWPNPNNVNQKLDTKGGFLINTGIGYQHMYSRDFGMSFGFGYQFNRLSYSGEKDYNLQIDYNRLTLKIGFVFN